MKSWQPLRRTTWIPQADNEGWEAKVTQHSRGVTELLVSAATVSRLYTTHKHKTDDWKHTWSSGQCISLLFCYFCRVVLFERVSLHGPRWPGTHRAPVGRGLKSSCLSFLYNLKEMEWHCFSFLSFFFLNISLYLKHFLFPLKTSDKTRRDQVQSRTTAWICTRLGQQIQGKSLAESWNKERTK